MILTAAVAMPHRNLNALGSNARKRRATHTTQSGESSWQTTSTGSESGSGHSSKGKSASQHPRAIPIGSTSSPPQSFAQHRRASSQSLTLDLQGLNLGQHSISPDKTETSALAFISGRSPPTGPHPLSQKDVSPSNLRLTDAHMQPLCQHAPVEEDSFAMHLRDCEDAHDIASVEAVLQRPRTNLTAKDEAHGPVAPVITEGNEQVLGGFASLGFVKSPRANLVHLGSETDVTVSTSSAEVTSPPVSPFLQGYEDDLSSWTALKMEKREAAGINDILSIDEMGLHSINVGSADDWRGTGLVAAGTQSTEHLPLAAMSPRTSTDNVPRAPAEWQIARSLRRQRKWIVTPLTADASRTVIVSDDIANGVELDQQPKAFSGQASFNLRFLRAGNGAPDCSIILSTTSTHRQRIEEQHRLATPTPKSLLSSVGLDQEQQMRGAAPPSVTPSDDAWPSLRTRTLTNTLPSPKIAETIKRERRLTHSKSTSTIMAQSVLHIESRRPSLGKSASHEGLAAEASSSRRTSDATMHKEGSHVRASHSDTEHSTSRSSASDGSSPASEKRHSLRAPSIGKSMSFETPPTLFPSESESPFGDYAIGLEPVNSTALKSAPQPLLQSPKDKSIELEETQSSRSSFHHPRERRDLSSQQGRPMLSTIDPARLAAFQAQKSPSSSGSFTASRGTAPTSPQHVHAKGVSHSRRDKSLGEWLRRKVKAGNVMTAASPSPSLWSPPLPPAWERSSTMSSAPSSSSFSHTSAPDLQQRTPVVPFFLAQSEAAATAAAGRPALPAAAKSEYGPFTPPYREQRRRSNSDDVLASMSQSDRARLQSMAKSDMGSTLRPHSPLSQANMSTSSSGNSEVDRSASIAASGNHINNLATPASSFSAPDRRSDMATSIGKGPFEGDSNPEVWGLDDVASDAMTMVVPLPLGNQADVAYASRYLRVSFVPFHLAASSLQQDSEDAQSTGHHNASVSGMTAPGGWEEEGDAANSTPTSPSTWYRRLARPFHGAPTNIPGAHGGEDESGPSSFSALRASASSAFHPSSAVDEKRDSFRIIAKVLASPQSGEGAAMASTTGVASTLTIDEGESKLKFSRPSSVSGIARLPQPFSFPVILGMCDSQGRLDLIPEGWQSIGLSAGPAPAYAAAASQDNGFASTRSGNGASIRHPMFGVADLIIAGCAACMNL